MAARQATWSFGCITLNDPDRSDIDCGYVVHKPRTITAQDISSRHGNSSFVLQYHQATYPSHFRSGTFRRFSCLAFIAKGDRNYRTQCCSNASVRR